MVKFRFMQPVTDSQVQSLIDNVSGHVSGTTGFLKGAATCTAIFGTVVLLAAKVSLLVVIIFDALLIKYIVSGFQPRSKDAKEQSDFEFRHRDSIMTELRHEKGKAEKPMATFILTIAKITRIHPQSFTPAQWTSISIAPTAVRFVGADVKKIREQLAFNIPQEYHSAIEGLIDKLKKVPRSI